MDWGRCIYRAAVSVGIATLLLLAAPFGASEYLRFTYQQTLANWLAKIRRPESVFVGDSITASGGAFGRFDTINLGSNGLMTFQIAATLARAQSLNPRHIYVMAGTNDAVTGPVDAPKLRALWRTIVADPRVTVTLPPHSRHAPLNRRIDEISRIAMTEACRASRRVIRLAVLDGPDGRLRPDYTIDGTHLSPSAIAVWKGRIGDPRLAERCPPATEGSTRRN